MWISVKDRLPEDGQPVLIYRTFPPGTMFRCDMRPLNREWRDVAQFTTLGDEKVFWRSDMKPIRYVSHWMPLPEMPNVD